jgi:hypothetical protein
MKIFLKIVFGIFLIVVVGMSLILFFAMYERIDNYERSNIWQLIDLSKKGIVYEDDVILQDNIFYRFSLGYIQDKNAELKEWKEAEQLGVDKFKNTSVFRIMGIGGYSPETGKARMEFEGSKIVLKFTLIPKNNILEDYRYRRGDESKTDILTYPKDKPFEIIMDLSKYPEYSSSIAKDNKEDWSYNKKICEIGLNKGEYHIKIENLNDVPEIKKIRTAFIITPARYGK